MLSPHYLPRWTEQTEVALDMRRKAAEVGRTMFADTNVSERLEAGAIFYDWTASDVRADDMFRTKLTADLRRRIRVFEDIERELAYGGSESADYDQSNEAIDHIGDDYEALTNHIPGLTEQIRGRFAEIQKCYRAGAYLASVVMIGSVLEGLLVARCRMSAPDAYRTQSAPKKRGDKPAPRIENWTLNDLIDVAAEKGWVNRDREYFSHALRKSRNVVHPMEQIRIKTSFDKNTCLICWHALAGAITDLAASLEQVPRKLPE